MLNGGYKIINFKDVNLTSGGDKVEVKDIYSTIENNYRKALLLSGLVVDGKEYNDLWCAMPDVESNSIYLYTSDLILEVRDDDRVEVIKCKRGMPVIDLKNTDLNVASFTDNTLSDILAVAYEFNPLIVTGITIDSKTKADIVVNVVETGIEVYEFTVYNKKLSVNGTTVTVTTVA